MGEAGGGVGGEEKRNKMRGVRRPGLVLCSLAISGPLSVTQPYAFGKLKGPSQHQTNSG